MWDCTETRFEYRRNAACKVVTLPNFDPPAAFMWNSTEMRFEYRRNAACKHTHGDKLCHVYKNMRRSRQIPESGNPFWKCQQGSHVKNIQNHPTAPTPLNNNEFLFHFRDPRNGSMWYLKWGSQPQTLNHLKAKIRSKTKISSSPQKTSDRPHAASTGGECRRRAGAVCLSGCNHYAPGRSRSNRRIYADRRHPRTALDHGNRARKRDAKLRLSSRRDSRITAYAGLTPHPIVRTRSNRQRT